jgi:hypothetical protein
METDDVKDKKDNASSSLTQMLYSTVRRSVEGDAKKSVCQIRGVPHPQACAFVSEATNLVAVAGWDADGNGVLLLSEFHPGEEPKRVGYHVLCRSAVHDESDEARRRRRLRGWTPEVPQTPEGGRLYIGDRLEVLERGMEQIQFEETDEFIAVTAINPEDKKELEQVEDEMETPPSEGAENGRSSHADSSVIGDSVQTEPLDDEAAADETTT